MRRRTQISFGAFYAGKFILLGVQLPFFSGWLALRGVSASDIGLITGSALVLRLVLGPVFAFWADRQVDGRRPLQLFALLFAASAILLNVPMDKLGLSASAVLLLWTFGMLVPLTDSAVMRAERGGLADFGRLRAVGSFSFLATTVIAGEMLTRFGVGTAASIMAGAATATFLASLALPPARRIDEKPDALSFREARGLLGSPPFLLMILAAGLIQGAHATYYAFSILHWTSLGYAPRIIGVLWAIGVAAEIFLLTRKRSLTARLRPEYLIALGGAGALVRWLGVAAEPPLPVLAAIQALHALSFAATYIGAIEFISRTVPARLANTAMTINSTTGVGAITGLATVAAGFLFDAAGARAAYVAMGAMAAFGGGVALFLLAPRMAPPERALDNDGV